MLRYVLCRKLYIFLSCFENLECYTSDLYNFDFIFSFGLPWEQTSFAETYTGKSLHNITCFAFRTKQHSDWMYLKDFKGKKIPFSSMFELKIWEGSPDLVLSKLSFWVWGIFLCCSSWYWSIHSWTKHYRKWYPCLFLPQFHLRQSWLSP